MAVNTVLVPLVEGASKLRTEAQVTIMSVAVTSLLETWMAHILREKPKFRYHSLTYPKALCQDSPLEVGGVDTARNLWPAHSRSTLSDQACKSCSGWDFSVSYLGHGICEITDGVMPDAMFQSFCETNAWAWG